ncbi:type IV secretion system protein [Thioalkalivibrio sp. ALE23]|uniref:type IV secretion system protein n=1 Tax=Thioalkalivibrio sp. ALE23 TaxID=1265495 RepID=UPI0009D9745A|nr:type IV secretion system protein [Thioalkalivibrio sp. ALE23]
MVGKQSADEADGEEAAAGSSPNGGSSPEGGVKTTGGGTNDRRGAKGKAEQGGEPPAQAPAPALNAKAIKKRFLHEGALQVERNRYFALVIGLMLTVIAMGFGMAGLAPLKSVVPYVIETDDIGRTQAAVASVEEFEPEEVQIRYFLAEWINQMMEIRPGVTQANLPDAFETTTGTAQDQFRNHLEEYEPFDKLAENPDRITEVRVRSMNMMPNDAVLVQFRTITREPNRPDEVEAWSLTANYSIVPPRTEQEILENPIGLQIENFDLRKEVGGS